MGTDPVDHAPSNPGARALIRDAVRFAGALSDRTGLYLSTGHGTSGTGPAVLELLSSGAGSWLENQNVGPCEGGVSLIAAHSAFASTSSSGLQGWSCSVHTTWPSYRTDWKPLAVATDAPTAPTCGSEPVSGVRVCGEAYILVAGAGVFSGFEGGPYDSRHAGSQSVNQVQCQSGKPVNCATGDFWHTFSDIAIVGRGPGIELSRTYNSRDAQVDGPFGFGWSWSYGMSASTDAAGAVTIVEEGGSTLEFAPGGSGGLVGPARVLASVEDLGGGSLRLTRRKTDRFTFDAAGRLVGVEDLNGNAVSIAYEASAPREIASISDEAGRWLDLTYTSGRITAVADSANRSVSFSYDADGDLVEAVDVRGGVWAFGYDDAHRMLTMREPERVKSSV